MQTEHHITRYPRATRWLRMFPMTWRKVSFEWKNREAEGWRGGGCGTLRGIMISNRRQGEAEHEGTKEGQTRRA